MKKLKGREYYKSGRIKADKCGTVWCVNKCRDDSIYCGTCEYKRYYGVWSRKFAVQRSNAKPVEY